MTSRNTQIKTFLKGQMMGMNQLSVFTGSGLCQHIHMANETNSCQNIKGCIVSELKQSHTRWTVGSIHFLSKKLDHTSFK